MWGLKNKTKKQTHGYRQQMVLCQWEGIGSWLKNVNRLVSTNWQLQHSLGDVKHSIENIVNNTVITNDASCVLTYEGITF